MLGAIAGDIIGSLHEGSPSRGRHFLLFPPRSTFTDDTVLSVAVAQSLRTNTPYDTALRHWSRRYPTAGYGARFQSWFEADNAAPYQSLGNGSAMRVAPVAWAFDTIYDVLHHARRSAAVTHDHPEGIRGAEAIAAAIYLARTGATKPQLATSISERFAYDCNLTLEQLQDRGGFDTRCEATVPLAIAAFLLSTDFEDAVRIAVSLGGDTDTLACIAGAIAEAHYGIPQAIQAEALRRLDGPLREEVRLFAERYQLVHLACVFPSLHVPAQASGLARGVLVEAVSVIVRVAEIHRRLRGGWRTFVAMVPNKTLCADMELARVGFCTEADALAFIARLERSGLRFLHKNSAVDIAMADPARLLVVPCDWLVLEDVRLTATGSRVTAACLRGGKIARVAVPEGWMSSGT
jgi:ADP-ribosylglycohydrolase